MDLVLTACGLVPCLGFLLWELLGITTIGLNNLPFNLPNYGPRYLLYSVSKSFFASLFRYIYISIGYPNFPQLMHKLDCLSMHLKSNLMISEISKINRFGRTISRVAPVSTYWTFLRIFLHTYLTEKLLLSPALCVQQN